MNNVFFKKYFILSMASIFSLQAAEVGFSFKSTQESEKALEALVRSFDQNIRPIYGDQTQAIDKIIKATDRNSFVLFREEDPVGILVYKTAPVSTQVRDRMYNLCELKTLFVINSHSNSGCGIGSRLINKCEEEVRALESQGIVVTASEEKPESLAFFKKKGFEVVEEYPGRYKKDITEYELAKVFA